MSNMVKLGALIAAAALTACGGGGGGGGEAPAPAPPKAEGVYVGTISGSTSRDFELLVLENDEFWAMYGINIGSSFGVAGFVQGQGASNNGSFTSSNVKDYGVSPAADGSLSATYSAANGTVSGSLSAGGQNVTFSGAKPVNTTYDYNAAANLSEITGAWTMQLLDGSSASLNIASSGAFTGSSSGCSFSGTLAPRASGKNVFNMSLTFGPSPCLLPGTTGTGIAITYPLQNSTRRQLVIAGTTSDRSRGTALFGTR